MWLRLNRKPKVYCVLKKINWVTNIVYHENRPHFSSKFESLPGSRLVSIASKYSSVILTLKVYFISLHKVLAGCTCGPRLNSLANMSSRKPDNSPPGQLAREYSTPKLRQLAPNLQTISPQLNARNCSVCG